MLNTIGAVSINRVHQIIGNVFGIPLSTGTVRNIVSRFAEAIKAKYARIGDSVATRAFLCGRGKHTA
ncbi:MAG: hypothetical protein IJP43_03410 [Oscillospiraceae bacterium]|nr:hypothetical protein [Oscillospiraceae bacterium]